MKEYNEGLSHAGPCKIKKRRQTVFEDYPKNIIDIKKPEENQKAFDSMPKKVRCKSADIINIVVDNTEANPFTETSVSKPDKSEVEKLPKTDIYTLDQKEYIKWLKTYYCNLNEKTLPVPENHNQISSNTQISPSVVVTSNPLKIQNQFYQMPGTIDISDPWKINLDNSSVKTDAKRKTDKKIDEGLCISNVLIKPANIQIPTVHKEPVGQYNCECENTFLFKNQN